MTTIPLAEMQADLLACLRRVEQGETLLIVREDGPLAEVRPPSPPAGLPRPHGLCAGEFRVPADFDAPLTPEILAEFEAG